jgi:hypothetical protein
MSRFFRQGERKGGGGGGREVEEKQGPAYPAQTHHDAEQRFTAGEGQDQPSTFIASSRNFVNEDTSPSGKQVGLRD